MKQVGLHRIISVFSPYVLDPGRARHDPPCCGSRSFIMWFGNTGNTIIACLLHSAVSTSLCKMSVLCKPTAGSVASYCVNMWGLGERRADLKDGTQHTAQRSALKFYIFCRVCF